MSRQPSVDRFFKDNDLYSEEKIPGCAQFKRMWRRSDMYSLPITLRYKGEKSFYTNFGALTSNIVVIVLVSFLLVYLHDMYNDSSVSSS